jgi:ABC-type antimicrobial peptide transport system permease subunit
LLALSGLSLLVAGVGVSATMLLSVRERRSEIGLRLAVGARRRDLIAQFLLESAALAGVGGAIGLTLGSLGAQAMSSWTRWQASLAPSVLLAAVGGTVLLGVLAGVWPAWRAATMDPVSALAGDSR